MKKLVKVIFLMVILAVSTSLRPAVASVAGERVENAVSVLEQILAIPESAIPPELLANAYGIAVVPQVIKAGFIIGGRHGNGILLARQESGAWSSPVFISLTGGSVGWQIGVQSTDVILVFKTRQGIDGILASKFTLGGDAAVAAGPVGRQVSGATDAQLKAEIYSYSRSRGAFIGISLEGSALQLDRLAMEQFYRPDVTAREVLKGEVKSDSAPVRKLQDLLQRYSRTAENP